jgi:hypothetical protein
LAGGWIRCPDGARLHEGADGFKITLDRHALDRLAALRGPGESNSDVVVRLTSSGEPR